MSNIGKSAVDDDMPGYKSVNGTLLFHNAYQPLIS